MRILFTATIISFLIGCNTSTQAPPPPQNEAFLKGLNFDEKEAYKYIQDQVAFGPRNPGSQGHEKCAQYLLSELKKSTDTAYFQEFEAHTFDNKIFKSKNIIAKVNPQNPNRILLCAHWDTRPFADQDSKNQNQPILGANDGASGVGVILALINNAKKHNIQLGIDIVFFDIEDYGQPDNSGFLPMENSYCLGSQYFAKNYTEIKKPRWGILLDMVGGTNATFLKEEISMLYAPNLVNRVWERGHVLGYSSVFIDNKLGAITDDHLYLNTVAQIPTIDIIHYKSDNSGFGDYWHTHNDNLESVNLNILKSVGTTLESILIEENQIGM